MIPYSVTDLDDFLLITWPGMPMNSEGSILDATYCEVMSVSFDGIFQEATAVVEGALKNTFFPLESLSGISLSALAPRIIGAIPRLPKLGVRIIGGDEATRISVILFCKKLPKGIRRGR